MVRIDVISEGYIAREKDDLGYIPRNTRIVLLPTGTLVASVVFTRGVGKGIQRTYAFRSRDWGRNWENLGPIFDWPQGETGWFERLNVSRSRDGKILGLGMLWKIPAPGVSYYDSDTGRTLDTDLYFSVSADEGDSWTAPQTIPLLYPEPPECGGVICVTRTGLWLAPYAPWLDGNGKNANQGKAAVAISEDQGATWASQAQFMWDPTGARAFAEVWTEELSDGRILGTSWPCQMATKTWEPLEFSLSHDGGRTFGLNKPMGLPSGPVATRALPEGRVICAYARRQADQAGIAIAVAAPDDKDFNLEFDDFAMRLGKATRKLDFDKKELFWMDFSFGEPCIEVLPDGTYYAAFWYLDDMAGGSRYVHFRIV